MFVATDRHTGDARALATGWRSRLDSGEAPATLGDPFLRGREFPLHTQEELVGIFGAEFAAAVMAIPSGLWSEPLRSSFGWHLVRVTQREAGGAAELAAVRDLVERDWREAQRATLDRDALQKLRARYDVVRDAALP